MSGTRVLRQGSKISMTIHSKFSWVFISLLFSFCSKPPPPHDLLDSLILSQTDSGWTREILNIANYHYDYNNYSNAKLFYDTVINLDSTAAEAYFKRGICKMQDSDFESSTIDFLKSVELNYRVADAYFNAGICEMMNLKNSDDAKSIEMFERCLKSNPDEATKFKAKQFLVAFKKNKGV